MTTTSEIKNELVKVVAGRASERFCELATITRLASTLQFINGKASLEYELHTPQIVLRVQRDIAELFTIRSEAKRLPPTSVRPGAPQFAVQVEDGRSLARKLGFIEVKRSPLRPGSAAIQAFATPIRGLPNRVTTGSPAELAAALRGAFLARGGIVSPNRTTSLEIICPTPEVAMALVGAALRIGVDAKSRENRGQHRLVVRDTDEIAKLLGKMGAVESQKSWIEARKARETRATANRLVNFDDANLRRSAQASVIACARVERALEILGDEVPEHLKYAGQLRLTYRDASLDELGSKSEPPLTKDAIAGRIRRLLKMADREATLRGIPTTEDNLPEGLAEAAVQGAK